MEMEKRCILTRYVEILRSNEGFRNVAGGRTVVLCEYLSIYILTDTLCSCLYRTVGPRRRLPGYRTTPQVLWLVSAVNMYVWYPVSESDHDLILPDAGLLQNA